MLQPSSSDVARGLKAASWRRIRTLLHSATGAFVAGSAALIMGPVILIWAMLGMDDQSISVHGWIAVVLGTIGTSALAIGLMAALFASDRNGLDGRVGTERDEGP
jgi:hypothetical protein